MKKFIFDFTIVLLLLFTASIGHTEEIDLNSLTQTNTSEQPNGQHDNWNITFQYGPITKENDFTYSNSQIESEGYAQYFSWMPYHTDKEHNTDEEIVKEIGADLEQMSHSPSQKGLALVNYGEHNGIPYVEKAFDFGALHIRQRIYVKDLITYKLEMESKLDQLEETASIWQVFVDSFSAQNNPSIPDTIWPNATWMSKLPERVKQLPLDRILLPGTHDSAAYTVDYRNTITDSLVMYTLYYLTSISATAREYLNAWTITQSADLYTQLKQGNRFFDLRVAYNPTDDRFYLAHTLTTIPLENGLEQIKLFAEEHPEEVIVISMKPDGAHKTGMSDKTERVNEEVTSILGPLLHPQQKNAEGQTIITEDMTLQKMVADNKRIVFFYRPVLKNEPISAPLIWDGSDSKELWQDTSNLKTKLSKLKKGLVRLQDNPTDLYIFVPATLTPQASDIIEGLKNKVLPNEETASNLKELTDGLHETFPIFFKENEENFKNVSAVMTDFPHEEFIEMIINYNITQTEPQILKQ